MTRLDTLRAALEAQAAAKKAYYAENKVGNWRPLYDELRQANVEVVKAARAYVKAIDGGGNDGISAGSPAPDTTDSGEAVGAGFRELKAS